ncbi:MAG: cadherin-like domain-containing protein, partial [Nitrospirota bacterium]
YSITAGNTGGAFAINAATGAITVANSAALDFETTPSFTLTVQASDGTLSDTAAITVNLNNLNEPPVNSVPSLATNAGSTVLQGFSDPITSAELHVTDLDNTPAQLIYTVTTAPVDGRLELTTAPGVAITSFTQADIDASRLVFVHSGAVSTSDSFTFTVSDGAGGTIGATTFTFTVTPFIPRPLRLPHRLTRARAGPGPSAGPSWTAHQRYCAACVAATSVDKYGERNRRSRAASVNAESNVRQQGGAAGYRTRRATGSRAGAALESGEDHVGCGP